VVVQKKNNSKEVRPKMNLTCTSCGQLKKDTEFYTSTSVFHLGTKRIPFCKVCLKSMSLDENGNLDIEKFKLVLKEIDKPYIYDLIQSSYSESKNTETRTNNDIVGIYFKNICSLNQYKNLGWKDSIFEALIENKPSGNIVFNSQNQVAENKNNYDLEELKDKFGDGYPDNEYYLFERKYQKLKPSVKVLTTFHDEFFREYCVDKVKETLAKATGNFKEAKEWASMAKDAATAGKLNPNQMSKADLSGGMDTFGQMARMVEETPKGELQSILPKFIERPKDKVDVVLWCNVNYVRDLKGMPSCTYKEIYKFYEDRKDSYENSLVDYDLEGDDNG